MTDKELIDKIARIWVENGGDQKGYDKCIRRIRDAIDRLLDRDDVHNGYDDLAVNRSRESS